MDGRRAGGQLVDGRLETEGLSLVLKAAWRPRCRDRGGAVEIDATSLVPRDRGASETETTFVVSDKAWTGGVEEYSSSTAEEQSRLT